MIIHLIYLVFDENNIDIKVRVQKILFGEKIYLKESNMMIIKTLVYSAKSSSLDEEMLIKYTRQFDKL